MITVPFTSTKYQCNYSRSIVRTTKGSVFRGPWDWRLEVGVWSAAVMKLVESVLLVACCDQEK